MVGITMAFLDTCPLAAMVEFKGHLVGQKKTDFELALHEHTELNHNQSFY